MIRRGSPRTRVLRTVLFTDIVASTERAVTAGDRGWRELLARHHAAVRRELKQHRGREIDTAGDGFFAAFEQPAEAIRCAAAVARAVSPLGIEVRAGLHMGECEVMGDKLGGIAVHIGARILAEAAPGEVLVSSTLKDLVAGSGLTFEDRGVRRLKGVPGEWQLYALEHDEAELEAPVGPEAPRPRRRVAVVVMSGVVAVGVIALVAAAASLLMRGREPIPAGPNTVAILDPSDGELRDGVRVGDRPKAIAVGDRSVWVANFGDETISRIDPATATVTGSHGNVGRPTAIVEGFGSVWIADAFGDVLTQLDVTTNEVVGAFPGAGGTGIAVGFGSVWIADPIDDAVLKLNPKTSEIASIALPSGTRPSAVAVGPDAIWVANSLSRSVTRLDPSGEIVVPTIALCCSPDAIAVGPSGIWVASSEDDTIVRVDPSTNAASLTQKVGDGPVGIAISTDAVWVASDRDRELWRLDPRTGDVEAKVALDGWPQGVAVVGDGDVWVTLARRS